MSRHASTPAALLALALCSLASAMHLEELEHAALSADNPDYSLDRRVKDLEVGLMDWENQNGNDIGELRDDTEKRLEDVMKKLQQEVEERKEAQDGLANWVTKVETELKESKELILTLLNRMNGNDNRAQQLDDRVQDISTDPDVKKFKAHDGDATRSGPGISPPKSVLPRRTRARSRSRSRPRFASLQQVNLARAEAAWDLGGGREAKDLSQSAVVVIDMQNDFAHPDGTFAQTFKTPGHLDMVEEINKVLALDWGLRVFTADNHPDNHVSFQTSTPTSKQDKKIENAGFDIVPLTYTKAAANHLAMLCDADYSATYAKAAAGACTGDGDIKVMQETYPVHCIQGTWGQRIVDGLRFSYNEPDDHLILKGQNAHIDSYSAIFNNLACAGDGTVETVSDKIGAVNVTVAKTTPCIPQGDIYPQDTNLPDLLRLSKIKHVYFVGLCLDYCVKYSAIHSAFLGRLAKFDWKTYVIQDLTRSCSPTKFHPEEAMQQITAQGVQFVQMSDVK